MSSKTITTVLGLVLVAMFSHIAYEDAVRISQNSRDREKQVETLHIKREKLDQELDRTIETKQKSQEEVQNLEKEKQKFEEERKKLEAELLSSNNISRPALVAVVSD